MTRTSNSLKSLACAVLAAAGVPAAASANEIEVPIDHVRTITLDRPAKTVFIGNPAIADVTVIDSRHVFVLGKSFGSTNLVTLDASGQESMNDPVVVTERPGMAVTVQRGIARTTMMCTAAHCDIAPAPGDDATSDTKQMNAAPPYTALLEQVQKRADSSLKAAGEK